eukprot:CAMPEP_0174275966 /NCGR_PEP_ID=MMETSP0439-20130205/60125_1 /TAXON_ID=0 /ORGANISM="Stereomyxa ramosa, Strain Chinc5" /LENGTH=251 /DNA_ID=CAMNT_0015368147 /DNA_START=320 /DNA_END=1076 /DNA_ORIENTATION=+
MGDGLVAAGHLFHFGLGDETTEGGCKYLSQDESTEMDVELMGPEQGFYTQQLMELAGLAVATAIGKVFVKKRVLVVCGPGNNGGDGLVAARHLFHFGYSPTVLYPKRRGTELFNALQLQCECLGIPFCEEFPEDKTYDFVVDCVFGYSFKGTELRAPFDKIIPQINDSALPIVCVDVPSGWDVDKGNIHGIGITKVEMVISLTAPKLCVKEFKGVHYLGGRFVPPDLQKKYNLNLPPYPSTDQVVLLPPPN